MSILLHCPYCGHGKAILNHDTLEGMCDNCNAKTSLIRIDWEGDFKIPPRVIVTFVYSPESK